MSIISEFYKRLRDLCEERGMTVNELAKALKLSSGSPTAWKNGAEPRYVTVIKIANYFGVSAGYLLGKETEKALILTEKDGRSDAVKDMNVLRIAGRDGSYEERVLTDEQLAALKAIIDQLPDASEDL